MLLGAHTNKKIGRFFLEIAWGAEYTESMTQPIRWLQDEIADRMLQKLDIVKLDVKDVLIVPDFPGKHLASFAKRYPNAAIYSLAEAGVSTFEMWRSKAISNWRSLFQINTNPLNRRFVAPVKCQLVCVS